MKYPPKGFTGCRISLDGEQWKCHGFRTAKENLKGAWTKLRMDYGNEYLPKSEEEFLERGGKIDWYRMF